MPLTTKRPKALMPVLNVPCIEHIIDHLTLAGISEIAVNTHHLSRIMTAYFEERAAERVPVYLSPEKEILGTAGALKKLQNFIGDETVLVINCDIVTNIDIRQALNYHSGAGALATLVLHDHPDYNQVLLDEKGCIIGIYRKKTEGRNISASKTLAFTGVQIVEPELVKSIPAGYSDIIDIYIKNIKRGGTIMGWVTSGHYWKDIGSIESYKKVHKDLFYGTAPPDVCPAMKVRWPVIAGSAIVDEKARIEGWTCVGDKSIIEKNAEIVNSIVWERVAIKSGAKVRNSIIADGAVISGEIENSIIL